MSASSSRTPSPLAEHAAHHVLGTNVAVPAELIHHLDGVGIVAGHLCIEGVVERISRRRRHDRPGGEDGNDNGGNRVAPGIYILEILVEGDAANERAQEIISVVY